jgi:hypothetical protein
MRGLNASRALHHVLTGSPLCFESELHMTLDATFSGCFDLLLKREETPLTDTRGRKMD